MYGVPQYFSRDDLDFRLPIGLPIFALVICGRAWLSLSRVSMATRSEARREANLS